MISAVCGRAPPAIQLLAPQPFLFPPADEPPRVSHDWLSVTNTRVLPSPTAAGLVADAVDGCEVTGTTFDATGAEYANVVGPEIETGLATSCLEGVGTMAACGMGRHA